MKYIRSFIAGLFVMAVVSVAITSVNSGLKEAEASEKVEVIAAHDAVAEKADDLSAKDNSIEEEASAVENAQTEKNEVEETDMYALSETEEATEPELVKKEWTKEEIAENYTMEQRVASAETGNRLGYWIYKPYETEEEMPLVVYLHGTDGCGSNLNRLLEIESIPQYIDQGKIYPNAIVISPQCPSGSNWTKQADSVMELIESVVEKENIDRSRISLTGASLGGIGTFNIAIKNPDYFSAIVPVCGSVTASKCNVLTDVAVKIYHGTKDTGMGFSVKDAANVIVENGGDCELNMLEGKGHEIRYVYYDEEFDVLDWMISQQRTDAAQSDMENISDL